MRQLTTAEIRGLRSDLSLNYFVKLSRLERNGPRLEWSGKTPLYIQMHKGSLVCIAPIAFDWAEGGPSDIMDDHDESGKVIGGCVLVEDYLMQIFYPGDDNDV